MITSVKRAQTLIIKVFKSKMIPVNIVVKSKHVFFIESEHFGVARLLIKLLSFMWLTGNLMLI